MIQTILLKLSFFIRCWHDISQFILWSYLCMGHKYELWFAIPVHYNPLADIKKNWFFYGWCRVAERFYQNMLKHNTTFFQKLVYDAFPWYPHQNLIGTNQTMKSSSGTRIRTSTSNQFFHKKMNLSNRVLNLELFSKRDRDQLKRKLTHLKFPKHGNLDLFI